MNPSRQLGEQTKSSCKQKHNHRVRPPANKHTRVRVTYTLRTRLLRKVLVLVALFNHDSADIFIIMNIVFPYCATFYAFFLHFYPN